MGVLVTLVMVVMVVMVVMAQVIHPLDIHHIVDHLDMVKDTLVTLPPEQPTPHLTLMYMFIVSTSVKLILNQLLKQILAMDMLIMVMDTTDWVEAMVLPILLMALVMLNKDILATDLLLMWLPVCTVP